MTAIVPEETTVNGFKLLGLCCILLSGGVALAAEIRKERRRLRVSDGWIELIRTVRTQIDCYLLPLDDILSGVCIEGATPSESSATQKLQAVLRLGAPYLSPEQYRVISELVQRLGQGYREEQLRLCDAALERLCPLRDALYAEYPLRLRLALTLSIGASVGFCILFW